MYTELVDGKEKLPKILTLNIFLGLYNFVLEKKIARSAIDVYLEGININKEEIESLRILHDSKIWRQYNINAIL